MKITIPTVVDSNEVNPCNENWEKMIPAGKGRFCLSCSKTVVDFTKKSKDEIQSFFKEAIGKIYGIFRKDQLQLAEMNGLKLKRIRVFTCALYLVFGTLLFSCNRIQPKKENERVEFVEAENIRKIMDIPVPGMLEVIYEETDEIQDIIDQLEAQNALQIMAEKESMEGKIYENGFIPLISIEIPVREIFIYTASHESNKEVINTAKVEEPIMMKMR